MQKIKSCLLLALFIPIMWNFCLSQEVTAETEQARLKTILKKTADYCERLKRIALDFVCNENIQEENYSYKKTEILDPRFIGSATPLKKVDLKPKGKRIHSWVYDYQMIKKGDTLEEKRILLKEKDKEKHVENAELKIKGFKAKFLVYGPVGFLSRYWQQHFNYEIIGQDEINGKKTIIISATPTEEREENYSFGKIWVNEQDFSILKIEWDPRYIPGFEEKVASGSGGIKRSLSWSVYYEVEKNRVRFPSRQIIEETFLTEAGKVRPGYTVNFIYGNYRFFTVEVNVKYD